MDGMLERVRIVMVEPTGAANIGSAARAIANMGVGRLVLVAPRCRREDETARAFASGAQEQLRGARVVETLGEALRGCVASYGTTARGGRYRRQHVMEVREAAREAIERAATGEVAFVFGAERTGLTNDDLLSLDRVVTIPAAPEYPALNVAAAIMIVCHELFAAASSRAERRSETDAPDRPASDEARRHMYATLFEALDRIGYFREPNRYQLQVGLRQLLGRVLMTEYECGLVFGIARQILWYIDRTTTVGERGAADANEDEENSRG